MDSDSKLDLERAQNELQLVDIIMQLSINPEIQTNTFNIGKNNTYFSSVISHSYYAIFYSAKAYLTKKEIRTKPPEEHKRTYLEFKKLVEQGSIDKELLEIYEDILIKAEDLLGIFRIEKKKRGEFTYKRLPQANLDPAKKSLENARIFFKHIYNLST